MIINGKDFWQFGGEIVNAETGEQATPEEAAFFHNEIKKREELFKETRIQNELAHQAWLDEYKPKMKEFFEFIDADDEDDFEDYFYNDESSLIYGLSTWIFDHTPEGYYDRQNCENPINNIKDFNEYLATHPQFLEDINHMKTTFPAIAEEAIAGFLDGAHDT